ncbi:MAG: amidohydrolase [Acidimicrobiales bacterium]
MGRYRADRLLTLDGSVSIVTDGVVDVDGGRISWVGAAADAPYRPDAPVHRVHGVLMPGFVNTHCHTPMVLLRGAGEGLPVDRWLTEVIWPRESRLVAEDVTWGMRLGAAELIRNGVTTSAEMFFHADRMAAAAAEVGLRSVVAAPVIESSHHFDFGSWQEQLDAMVDLAAGYADHDLIDVALGPHAAYSTSEACLRGVGEVAREHGLMVQIHLAEQDGEDARIRERYGNSVPAFLADLGVLDADVLGAHGIWFDDDDIDILVDHDVAIAHCPCSNAKHGSGVIRLGDLRAAGVKVGLGTDGPVSHNRLDIFEEMRTAIRLQRAHHADASLMTVADVLTMATTGGAAVLRRDDIGRLAPGCRADMIAVSLDDPAFTPVVDDPDDLLTHLVWAATPASVTDAWIEGRHVLDAGRVTTIDLGEAVSEVARRARRLAS